MEIKPSLSHSHYASLRLKSHFALNTSAQRRSAELVPPGSPLELWVFNKWTLRGWGIGFISSQIELPESCIRNVLARIGCGQSKLPNPNQRHDNRHIFHYRADGASAYGL